MRWHIGNCCAALAKASPLVKKQPLTASGDQTKFDFNVSDEEGEG